MFGTEGPNMEGYWYNPKTGDQFIVRNSFFQDNQYLVQTTDGRLIEYDQLQHYVQTDKPIDLPKPEPKEEPLPAEVADLIATDDTYLLPEDANLLQPKKLGNLSNTLPKPQVIIEPVNTSDAHIIDKALGKKDMPDLQVNIDWVNCPEREIEVLIDIMDINPDSIIDWYTSQIDVEYVANSLRSAVKDFINKKFAKQEEIIKEQESGEKPDQDQDNIIISKKPRKTGKVKKKS